jgi:CRISPR/Cas system-associated exonuclease Cas4 (RecB family)
LKVLLLAQFKEETLNKNEIEKQTGMKGRQSIYNYIDQLKSEGFHWIEVADSKPWRAGGTTESYRLTPLGMYRAILYNPEFKEKAKLVLDFDFEKIKEEKEASLKKNELAELRDWFRTIEHVIENGKAPPTWHFTLEMRADNNGRLSYRIRTGTDA